MPARRSQPPPALDTSGGAGNTHNRAHLLLPQVYVGNASVANNKPKLAAHGIASVVNCQDITATNFFESDKAFTYFRFPISHWSSDRTHDMATDAGVLGFFAEVWAFMKKVTDGGGSVLVHCLAGAHRAGTTGVAWLMHASGLDKATAIRTAKLCRSAINPIFGLVTLLDRLDPAIANRRLQAQR